MIFGEIFARREPRKFGFTPYYYQKQEKSSEEPEPRIKFRRIRPRTVIAKKSIRRILILAILLILGFYYFWGMVQREAQTFKIEDIRIEDTPGKF